MIHPTCEKCGQPRPYGRHKFCFPCKLLRLGMKPRLVEPKELKTCRHCLAQAAKAKRGLCYRCYSNPEVRDLYPPKVAGCNVVRTAIVPAAYPTTAFPGTAAKIFVMAERAMRRQELFHPDDSTFGLASPLEEEMTA